MNGSWQRKIEPFDPGDKIAPGVVARIACKPADIAWSIERVFMSQAVSRFSVLAVIVDGVEAWRGDVAANNEPNSLTDTLAKRSLRVPVGGIVELEIRNDGRIPAQAYASAIGARPPALQVQAVNA